MNIPLNIDWQQIILHLLNFAILAGGLYFLLYHPVRKFMDQREEHYRQMENEAQQRLDQAKATEGSEMCIRDRGQGHRGGISPAAEAGR